MNCLQIKTIVGLHIGKVTIHAAKQCGCTGGLKGIIKHLGICIVGVDVAGLKCLREILNKITELIRSTVIYQLIRLQIDLKRMTAGGTKRCTKEAAADITGVGNAHGVLNTVGLHGLKYFHPVLGGNRLRKTGICQIIRTNQRAFTNALRLIVDHGNGVELASIGGQVTANIVVTLKNCIVVGSILGDDVRQVYIDVILNSLIVAAVVHGGCAHGAAVGLIDEIRHIAGSDHQVILLVADCLRSLLKGQGNAQLFLNSLPEQKILFQRLLCTTHGAQLHPENRQVKSIFKQRKVIILYANVLRIPLIGGALFNCRRCLFYRCLCLGSRFCILSGSRRCFILCRSLLRCFRRCACLIIGSTG